MAGILIANARVMLAGDEASRIVMRRACRVGVAVLVLLLSGAAAVIVGCV